MKINTIHPINILHVSTAHTWRGGEQQLVYLYDELYKTGVQQLIVCAKGSALEKKCIGLGKQYISLSRKNSFDIFFAYQLKRISEKYSLIHVHDSHAHTMAMMAAMLFGNKLPIVVSRRVDFSIGRNIFSSLKYNHKQVKKIICVSDAIKKMIAPDIKNKDKLITIYDGIDLNRFNFSKTNKLRQEFNIPSDYYLIGNVAALAPHKDYYTFIDTAAILIQKNIKAMFFIIGEGAERKKIEQYIKEKKLTSNVILTGFRNDVAEILPEMDVFLMTSETEGLGSSVLDAMACNVPVVATEAGGVPELISHEISGLLAPVKNANKLAENVMEILSNQNLKKVLKSNAAQKVKGFSVKNMASKTLQVYQKNS